MATYFEEIGDFEQYPGPEETLSNTLQDLSLDDERTEGKAWAGYDDSGSPPDMESPRRAGVEVERSGELSQFLIELARLTLCRTERQESLLGPLASQLQDTEPRLLVRFRAVRHSQACRELSAGPDTHHAVAGTGGAASVEARSSPAAGGGRSRGTPVMYGLQERAALQRLHAGPESGPAALPALLPLRVHPPLARQRELSLVAPTSTAVVAPSLTHRCRCRRCMCSTTAARAAGSSCRRTTWTTRPREPRSGCSPSLHRSHRPRPRAPSRACTAEAHKAFRPDRLAIAPTLGRC